MFGIFLLALVSGIFGLAALADWKMRKLSNKNNVIQMSTYMERKKSVERVRKSIVVFNSKIMYLAMQSGTRRFVDGSSKKGF